MRVSKSSRLRVPLLASSSLVTASLFAGVASLSALIVSPSVALAADECGDPSANGAAADTLVCAPGPYVTIDYSTTTNGNLELQFQDAVTVTNGVIVTGKANETITLRTTTAVPNSGDILVVNAAGAAIGVSGQGALVTVDLRTTDAGDSPTISGVVGIDAANTVGATEVHMNGGVVTSTGGVGVDIEGVTGVDVTLLSGTTVSATGGYAVIAKASSGDSSVVVGGTFMGDGGLAATAGGAGIASVVVQSGSTVTGTDGFSYGAFAQATGTGTATVEVQGDVADGGVGVFTSSGTASLVGNGSIIMLGAFDGAEVAATSGSINIDFTGDISSAAADGLDTFTDSGTTSIVLGGTVSGGDNAVEASSNSGDISIAINGSALASNGDGVNVAGGGAVEIEIEGDVTSQSGKGIYALHTSGGTIAVTVGAAGSITSNVNVGIDIQDGSGTVIVAGTVNGGAAGAIRFDQIDPTFANRLELRSSFVINGLVIAGQGFGDTLAFGGSGSGTFDLAAIDPGDNSRQYRGFENFVVDNGRWAFSGATAASFAVNSGGTLGGNGTFGGIVVNSGGTLAPGNSIGTITVNGPLSFAAGSVYEVEVSPTDADRINVTGDADLSGGTVVATYEPGAYVTKRYIILSADGGLSGTEFAGLSGAAPFGMHQRLGYDANTVYLIIDDVYASSLGLTQNQQAVASAINGFFDTNGGIPGAFVGLLPGQINQLTGEVSTGAMGAGMDATGQFLSLIGDPGAGAGGNAGDPLGYAADAAARADVARWSRPLSSLKALAALSGETEDAAAKAAETLALTSAHAMDTRNSPWHLWGSAYGGGERVKGNATVGSADLSARTWGIASGVTRNFDGGRIGIALGGAGTSFSLAGGLGSGSATSFNAGIHGTGYFGDGYVSAALAYGYHATRTSRAVPGDILSARFGAQTFGGRLEAGYRLNLGGVALTPYGALEATAYRLPGYTERSALGGPFALTYGAQTETAVRTELGARSSFDLGGNAKLTTRAAWVWNADAARSVTAAFQALPGTSFTINGAQPARHAAQLEAGVEAGFGNVTAKLTATGEFSRNVTSFGANAKVGIRW